MPLFFGASLLAAASVAGLVLVMIWFAVRTFRPELASDEALVQRRVDVTA